MSQQSKPLHVYPAYLNLTSSLSQPTKPGRKPDRLIRVSQVRSAPLHTAHQNMMPIRSTDEQVNRPTDGTMLTTKVRQPSRKNNRWRLLFPSVFNVGHWVTRHAACCFSHPSKPSHPHTYKEQLDPHNVGNWVFVSKKPQKTSNPSFFKQTSYTPSYGEVGYVFVTVGFYYSPKAESCIFTKNQRLYGTRRKVG